MYHSHYYSGMTSISHDHHNHSHGYRGETSLSPSGVPHVYYIVGYTTYDDGHRHYYAIQTGLDYPVPGEHTHYISGITHISEDHYHLMNGPTNVSP